MMSMHVGLRRKRAPAAIIGFSGMLIGPEHLGETTARDAKGAPPPILLILCLAASLAAGAAWAYVPGLLKVKRGTHEVITTILLNYVAQNTTRYLATVPLRDPNGQAIAYGGRLFNTRVSICAPAESSRGRYRPHGRPF